MSEEVEKETFMAERTRLTLQITGAAIFGALSIVVSMLTAPILPRVPGWGIAYFDPVSIIWVACFLIFGPTAGILCCVIGMVGLMPFDPFAPIGPLMKFSATFALIIVPILMLKLYKNQKGTKNSQKLKDPKNYVIYGGLGMVLRIIVMLAFNIWLFMTLFSDALAFVSLDFIGIPSITGWTALIIGAILINAFTTIWDLLIPYLVVFGAKLDEKFEIW